MLLTIYVFFLFFFDEYEVVEFLARWISVVRQSFWLKAKMLDTGSRQLRLFCSWFFLPLELGNIVGVFLPVVQVLFFIWWYIRLRWTGKHCSPRTLAWENKGYPALLKISVIFSTSSSLNLNWRRCSFLDWLRGNAVQCSWHFQPCRSTCPLCWVRRQCRILVLRGNVV